MINNINIFDLLIVIGIIFISLFILFIFCACAAAGKDNRLREEIENDKLSDKCLDISETEIVIMPFTFIIQPANQNIKN